MQNDSIPKFALPFRASGSSFVVVEQDSAEEIEQCVEAAVKTIVGSRIDAPGYGIPDETFKQQEPNPSAEVYLAAVQAAEPRARLLGEARTEELIQRVVLTPEAISQ